MISFRKYTDDNSAYKYKYESAPDSIRVGSGSNRVSSGSNRVGCGSNRVGSVRNRVGPGFCPNSKYHSSLF